MMSIDEQISQVEMAVPAYIALTFKVYKDGETGQYVSECLELGVSSCGDTIEAAFDQLKDAVEVYLDTLEEEGERGRVFTEHGIQVMLGEPTDQERQVLIRPAEIVTTNNIQLPLRMA